MEHRALGSGPLAAKFSLIVMTSFGLHKNTYSGAGVERYDYLPFAAAAFELDSVGHHAGEQTAAAATQRSFLLGCYRHFVAIVLLRRGHIMLPSRVESPTTMKL